MKTRKPSSVQRPWTLFLLRAYYVFRIVVSILLPFGFVFAFEAERESQPALAGFRDAILLSFDLDTTEGLPLLIGILLGSLLIPFVLAILGLVFLKSRRWGFMLVLVIIDTIIGMATRNMIICLAALLLFFMIPRDYFRDKKKEAEDAASDVSDHLVT
ncbi:MAG: hypothetical protein AAFU64_15770 [Bacteroidota bacterium]